MNPCDFSAWFVESQAIMWGRIIHGDDALTEYGADELSNEELTRMWDEHTNQMKGIAESRIQNIVDDET